MKYSWSDISTLNYLNFIKVYKPDETPSLEILILLFPFLKDIPAVKLDDHIQEITKLLQTNIELLDFDEIELNGKLYKVVTDFLDGPIAQFTDILTILSLFPNNPESALVKVLIPENIIFKELGRKKFYGYLESYPDPDLKEILTDMNVPQYISISNRLNKGLDRIFKLFPEVFHSSGESKKPDIYDWTGVIIDVAKECYGSFYNTALKDNVSTFLALFTVINRRIKKQNEEIKRHQQEMENVHRASRRHRH